MRPLRTLQIKKTEPVNQFCKHKTNILLIFENKHGSFQNELSNKMSNSYMQTNEVNESFDEYQRAVRGT